jgi:chromosome partitioning protein
VRKIAVLNQKGGVGKTTTVVNVAAALADAGQRVMVIDLDPQAHLTIHLGSDSNNESPGIYEILTDRLPVKEALRPVRENLQLVAASIDLVGAESELVSEVGREIILKQGLEAVEDEFDFLLIDCPPSLGLLALNALSACDEVLIPIQPHFLALQGFSRLLQTVTLVQTRINPKLRVSAILMCMFDSRTSLSSEVRADIDHFLSNSRDSGQPWANASIIPVNVRRNVKLAEAPSHGQTIYEYEPNCNGAEDYRAVADFLRKGTCENDLATKTESIERTEEPSQQEQVSETVPSPSPSPEVVTDNNTHVSTEENGMETEVK